MIHVTRKLKLPGFEGISLWEILFFFGWSIRRGYITTRASSLAFHFFLAMIPFGLLLVVLSSQLHFFDLKHEILPILGSFIPEGVFDSLLGNMEEFENSSVTSLVSFGFLVAIYFTSNGFRVMIKTFNSSRVNFEKRKWWSIRLTAFMFVLVSLAGIILLFVSMLLERKAMVKWIQSNAFVADNSGWIFGIFAFITCGLFLYIGIAVLYYFGPSKRKQFKFFSAGATLATVLIVLISEAYSLYVRFFSTYDDLYGSLGTLMILMLWIYLVSIALLLGFELNASIHGALAKKRLDNLKDIEDRYQKTF
ncbi:MAG: YihY/virulence factor BrkB family protein [Crocinitomicaceae bacterium]|nr:YihY/virulence factor BrkB family protein [Crocinitomicaceae bacterium]